MDISYRKLLILKELQGYKADLMCLEEVDEKVYQHDLVPVLALGNAYNGESVWLSKF